MKRAKSVFSASLSLLSIGLIATSVVASYKNVDVAFAYSNTTPSIYYQNIGDKTGKDLLNSLRTLNASKRRTLISYSSMFSYFDETDPGTSSGKVRSFYTGQNCSKVTREHVWPYSKLVLNDNTGNTRGDNDIEKDLHMIRPADSSINEGRGNSFYTYNPPNGQGWDPGDPENGLMESYRGEAARIIFYSVVADSGLSLVDKDYDSSSNHTMGKLSTLLEWNLKYSITSNETTRNSAVERLQGHRNPFVDHPEYACRIWGDTNSKTKSICGLDSITKFELSDSSRTIKVGANVRLDYTIEPITFASKVVIKWSSDNPSVASVDEEGGLISAKSEGSATITATIVNYYISASCSITVISDEDSGGDTPKKGVGCSGNIVTTSSILFTLSLIGIATILIRKRKK